MKIELSTLIIGFLSGLVWLIRLEAKVLYLEKDHDTHKTEVKEKETLMWAKVDGLTASMNLVLQSLARLEGSLQNKNQRGEGK
jgi:hypothetical protein